MADAALKSLRTHELFIGGHFVEAASSWDVEDPATGSVLAAAGAADVAQVDTAVRAAAEAFKTWRNVSDADRATWLREWDGCGDAADDNDVHTQAGSLMVTALSASTTQM